MNISICEEPFATDKWYSGEVEIDNKKYYFTLYETSDGYVKEVSWVEDIPPGSEELEKEILRQR